MSRRPHRKRLAIVLGCLLGTIFGTGITVAFHSSDPPSEPRDPDRTLQANSEQEARTRAAMLYETIQGSLLVIHRDFFNDESPRVLPSQSLDDVFAELESRFDIEIQWLTGDADEMNVDHRPTSEFELDAVAAMKRGEETFVRVDEHAVRFVGRIPLASQCLKCHVARRTSLEDRFSGLEIHIPFHHPAAVDEQRESGGGGS